MGSALEVVEVDGVVEVVEDVFHLNKTESHMMMIQIIIMKQVCKNTDRTRPMFVGSVFFFFNTAKKKKPPLPTWWSAYHQVGRARPFSISLKCTGNDTPNPGIEIKKKKKKKKKTQGGWCCPLLSSL